MTNCFQISLPCNVKSRSLLFLLFLSVHFVGYTQFSFYKNYTSNDGLPSSRIYDMIQDNKGYMWFATENGVSKFDGYNFTNYTTHDGLPANSTLKLYEDYMGRIWFASYRGPLSYYHKDKITKFELNEEFAEMGFSQFFDNIYIDSTNTMWLSPYHRGIFTISTENKINKEFTLSNMDRPNIRSLYYFTENGETITWTLSEQDIARQSNLLKDKTIKSIEFTNKSKHHYYQNHHCKIADDDYLFSLGEKLKRVKNGKVIFEKNYEEQIISIFMDSDKNIWIAELFNCLYMYPKGKLDAEPVEYLPTNSVSKTLQDKEGSYWISTTENGVFCVPGINFANYNKAYLNIENDQIITLDATDNQLFITTNNKGIHSFYIEENRLRKNNNFKLEGFIKSNVNDLLITSNNRLWVSNSEFFMFYLNGNKVSESSQSYFVGYEIIELSDKSILLSHIKGISKYKNADLIYESKDHSFRKQVFCLSESPDSTLFLGTFEGLYKYKNEIYSKYDSACPVLNSRISAIKMLGSNLWVGTFNNGLVINNKNGHNYINTENGLSSNRIKSILIENENNVWVGTNKGLSHILITDLQNFKFTIINYSIWDGLPSNEINDIIKLNELIWLATDKGLVSFKPNKLIKSNTPPKLVLESILVNENRDIHYLDSTVFKSDQNNVSFNYKAISFKDPGNITYYYKLEGLDEKWLETENTSVRYPELNYGDYIFTIKAKNVTGTLSEPIVYNFTIKKHFTQTIVFASIIILCGLGFVALLFFVIFNSIKKREKLKQQVILAEQTALRAQMNPHFIFNSLNSIQDFILKRDDKNANFYLANFSTLMRRILEISKQNSITLREEIEITQVYLDLEKLRFEELFRYEIKIDKTLNLDEILIPTMLLQTYIENAIWHGLVPKNDRGVLELSFKHLAENKLMVSIEDNGIGRVKASEISKKRKHHRSMGMKNTDDRIKLINRLNRTNISIEVIDLYTNNNEAQGTRIEIVFDI